MGLLDEIREALPENLKGSFDEEVRKQQENLQPDMGMVTEPPADVNPPVAPSPVEPPVAEAPMRPAPIGPSVAPSQAAPTPPPQPQVSPGTQELQDVVGGLQSQLKAAEDTNRVASMPPVTNPNQVTPDMLTEADYKAMEQMMRGEPPTANLQQHLEAAAIRHFGG